MSEQTTELLRQGVLWALPVLAAIVFHEVAHGFAARWLGDPTAGRAGRLTLNPLPHIDPLGTVLLPLLLILARAPFLFGWAKPVPINPARLGHPRRDTVLVAAAGPAANCLLAFGCSVSLVHLLPVVFPLVPGWVVASVIVPLEAIIARTILVNVVLAVFNILPIPPLDGGRVLMGLLPLAGARVVARVEPFGIVLVVALMATRWLGPLVGYPIMLLLAVVGAPWSVLVSYL